MAASVAKDSCRGTMSHQPPQDKVVLTELSSISDIVEELFSSAVASAKNDEAQPGSCSKSLDWQKSLAAFLPSEETCLESMDLTESSLSTVVTASSDNSDRLEIPTILPNLADTRSCSEKTDHQRMPESVSTLADGCSEKMDQQEIPAVPSTSANGCSEKTDLHGTPGALASGVGHCAEPGTIPPIADCHGQSQGILETADSLHPQVSR